LLACGTAQADVPVSVHLLIDAPAIEIGWDVDSTTLGGFSGTNGETLKIYFPDPPFALSSGINVHVTITDPATGDTVSFLFPDEFGDGWGSGVVKDLGTPAPPASNSDQVWAFWASFSAVTTGMGGMWLVGMVRRTLKGSLSWGGMS